MKIFYALCLLLNPCFSAHLRTNLLNTCMKNSKIQVNHFDLFYDSFNKTLFFDIDLDSTINNYIKVKFQVYAYGNKLKELEIDPCKLGIGNFCPMTSGKIDTLAEYNFKKNEYGNSVTIINNIPNVVYYIPDLDLEVKVIIFDSFSKKMIACLSTSLVNDKQIYNSFFSGILNFFLENNITFQVLITTLIISNKYFRDIAIYDLIKNGKVSPIFSSWSKNFNWTLEHINNLKLQAKIEKYVLAFGGLINKRKIENEYGKSLNNNFFINGLIGHTIFSLFIFFFTNFLAFLLFFKLRKQSSFLKLKSYYLQIFFKIKGVLFMYYLLSFPNALLLSFWELFHTKSTLCLVLAFFYFFIAICPLNWIFYTTFRKVKSSKVANSKVLYHDKRFYEKYGSLYFQYSASAYYFYLFYFVYEMLKAIIISVSTYLPYTQSILLILLETAYLILIFYFNPHFIKLLNIFNIFIQLLSLINSIHLCFSSAFFLENYKVRSLSSLGAFFINFIATIIILATISYLVLKTIKNNLEKRFPIKDDRITFISDNLLISEKYDELTRLREFFKHF